LKKFLIHETDMRPRNGVPGLDQADSVDKQDAARFNDQVKFEKST
jgi:hypothetical protein